MHYRQPGTDLLADAAPDGFVLLKEIGVGSSGTVYQAMETARDSRLVALKMMHATEQRLRAEAGDAANPYHREYRFAQAVRHPHIARVYRTGALPDGTYFVAMELVDGISLAEDLRHRGWLPLDEAARLVSGTAEALAALHEAGIVYRDLKPGNLMVRFCKDGAVRIKLIDLGAAKLVHEPDDAASGHDAAQVGSPQYMAPEQAQGLGTTPASDIYALAAVLYELITGVPVIALKRPTMDACLTYLRSSRPIPSIPLVDLLEEPPPAPIASVLDKSLSRDPAARPGSVLAFKVAADAVLCGPSSPRTRPRHRARVGLFARLLGGRRRG